MPPATRHPHWSTWYPGTESDWRKLTTEERETTAFTATGCEVAWPRWETPVNCVHGGCRVRRGECHPMTLVNGLLRYEGKSGWLRFCSRDDRAKVYRHVRRTCRETKVYDAWKACWQVIVGTGVSAIVEGR